MNNEDVSRPRVSVGMPIYNGAKTLAAAIESLTNQTDRDIEIIISNNGSIDGTAAICEKYAAMDSRIRYFKQDKTLCPTKNFNFVVEKSCGDFFMWAAHDDTRDLDFIEKLLGGLERNPGAILAFGDIVQYTKGVAAPFRLDFENKGKTGIKRLHWAAVHPLHHLYGLWRMDALRKINWRHVDWWHDTPLMMAATAMGDFVYVPGTRFHYLNNQHHFFFWRHGPGLHSPLLSGQRYLKRLWDLILMVWLSTVTVADVAGWRMGILAGIFCCVKIAHQAAGFIGKRI